MSERPTPEEVLRLSALDVVGEFIGHEVGWHTDAMREQARDLLDALAAHGYVIVHPDDVPTEFWMPGTTHTSEIKDDDENSGDYMPGFGRKWRK